jgi:biotin carboxyl carrier protein
MKKFLIKVNGNQYEVEVEEIRQKNSAEQDSSFQAVSAAPAPASAPAPAPAAAPAPAPTAQNNANTVPAGAKTINAPMPGTILSIEVNAGDSVKKGQVLLILEAMKMENEIVAPDDGKIVSVNVEKGASVNVGDVLVSMQ